MSGWVRHVVRRAADAARAQRVRCKAVVSHAVCGDSVRDVCARGLCSLLAPSLSLAGLRERSASFTAFPSRQ